MIIFKTGVSIYSLFIGLFINILITIPVYSISSYMNPKTYYGSIGHNNALTTLFFTSIIWIILCVHYYIKGDKKYFNGQLISFVLNLFMLVILSIYEYKNWH